MLDDNVVWDSAILGDVGVLCADLAHANVVVQHMLPLQILWNKSWMVRHKLGCAPELFRPTFL